MPQMVDIEYISKKHFISPSSSEIPKYNLSKAKSRPVMNPYKDIIREWLKLDKTQPKKQRHAARRIFNRLCDEDGFTGSESSVRSYVSSKRLISQCMETSLIQ